MAEQGAQEKTEKATSKRKEKAREEGQVCQSREVTAVALLLSVIAFLYFFMPIMISGIMSLTQDVFGQCAIAEVTTGTLPALMLFIVSTVGKLLAPFLLLCLVVAVGANVGQTGFNWSPKAIKPKLDKLNFVKGLGKLFKITKVFDLFKNVAKVSIIGYVAYGALRSEFQNFISLGNNSPMDILGYMGHLSFLIAIRVAAVMVVLAVIDYVWQRYQYEKNLKMSKQEKKDEFKQVEGDPLIKSKIRRIQYEVAQRRMMEAVPTADVVLTNPTHIAIAIKYDSKTMAAPEIVAKGKGFVAEKIRLIATENGIPILERKPLAHALYKMVKVGESIPLDLYESIAEILAFVYRLKKKAG